MNTPENSTVATPKRSRRFFSSPKFLLGIVIILSCLVIEGLFDVVEKGVGEFLVLTNAIRPRVGPVWKREINDEIATRQLQEMISEIPEEKPPLTEILSFESLLQHLEQQPDLLISKKNFLKIYAQLPYSLAQQIISPYDLLELMPDPRWQQCRLQKSENDLAMYLLDGENELLKNCHLALNQLDGMAQPTAEPIALLENSEEFQGRTISRTVFLTAFNTLPANIKIFVMNDPMQLIRWDESLRQVAISRYVIDGAVSVGFQIQTGISSSVARYQASEIAAAALVDQINKILTDKFLAMPERKALNVDENL